MFYNLSTLSFRSWSDIILLPLLRLFSELYMASFPIHRCGYLVIGRKILTFFIKLCSNLWKDTNTVAGLSIQGPIFWGVSVWNWLYIVSSLFSLTRYGFHSASENSWFSTKNKYYIPLKGHGQVRLFQNTGVGPVILEVCTIIRSRKCINTLVPWDSSTIGLQIRHFWVLNS